jgi:hypothetical protein
MGISELADRLHQKGTGAPVSPAVARGLLPALGTASGIAYSMYKAREAEAVRNAFQGTPESVDHAK